MIFEPFPELFLPPQKDVPRHFCWDLKKFKIWDIGTFETWDIFWGTILRLNLKHEAALDNKEMIGIFININRIKLIYIALINKVNL